MPFLSVVYFSRGNLPKKELVGQRALLGDLGHSYNSTESFEKTQWHPPSGLRKIGCHKPAIGALDVFGRRASEDEEVQEVLED